MDSESSIRRYRNAYAKLLRLYPKHYQARFGEGMEQTFHDLCRERVKAGRELFSFALWMFCETAAGIFRENATTLMRNKIFVRPAIGAGLIVMIPLVFTLLGKWKWRDPRGYVFAFVVLYAFGLTYELVARKMTNRAYRFAVGLAVMAAFATSWGNMIRVSESENLINLLYYVVPAIGALGAVIARFQPRGMALALFATALAQLLVPAILAFLLDVRPAPSAERVFVGSVVFTMVYVASGLLFLRASAPKAKLPE